MSLALAILSACSSAGNPSQIPQPTWARGPDAQRDARVIDSIWRDGSLRERQATVPLINRFIAQYPGEPRTRTMRLRLAWLSLENNDLDMAKSLIDGASLPSAGSDRDMARVLEATILARRGQPLLGLAQLRELGGGLIDSETRELWA
ncbi:MAG TPA: hypothetical protein VIV60_13910, partial [Polyangiaceae bacterium]